MSKHLFLFTIGPVQSFIAQARKTQDLYAGSYILSELMNEAREFITKNNNCVILPAKKSESVTNRILAIISNESNLANLQQFGIDVENVVRNKLKDIANKTLGNQNKPVGFDEQIENHLEIYWIFKEIQGDNYSTSDFQELEKLLGAVKNVRLFKQISYNNTIGEKGRKCSLCGERNALFFNHGSNPNYINLNNAQVLQINEVELAENEGLCAVCFVKRFWGKSHFPSTAEIAILDCLQTKIKEFDDFRDVFDRENLLKLAEKEKNINLNGKDLVSFNEQFYFEENIKSENIPCQEQLEFAKKYHKKLTEALKKQNLKFQKYYAVITFDGDSMGKWLSGEYLKDEYKQNAGDYHKDLSQLLLDFASKARKIVDDNEYGKTVYAGGDDFLGLINLKFLFKVLYELRKKFKDEVSDKIQKYLKDPKELSFSAGICIAHYKEPLSLVLGKARQMLELAKEFDEHKDCLAIHVIKGSGEAHTTVWKNFFNDQKTNFENIIQIIDNLKTKPNGQIATFSDTFIQNLQREFSILVGKYDKLIVDANLLKSEIRRLVLRSCQLKGEEKKQKSQEFSNLLIDMFSQNMKVKNFFEMLNIANFIQRNINP